MLGWMEQVDICIAGAGILGVSTAYHLAQLNPNLKIAIIDVDPSGKYSSTQRNAGGVRAFWHNRLTQHLCLDSIQFFKKHAKHFGFHNCGYVWLHDKDHPIDTSIVDAFKATPTPITVFDPKDNIPQIPWDFKREDLSCISFHPEAGLLNPDALKKFLLTQTKERLKDNLSMYLGNSISDLEQMQRGWKINLSQGPRNDTELLAFYSNPDKPKSPTHLSIQAEKVVIALGAWSPHFLKPWQKIHYECAPIARHIAFIDAPEARTPELPMVVDSSGVYFHPEGGHLLVGYADKNQVSGYDFSYSEETFFTEKVWPLLYERSPVFESCKHLEGWSGLYSYSPDQDGILGDVVGNPGLYQIHSFTGRGVMVSFAAGRALAEWMSLGHFQALDCTSLSEQRFESQTTNLKTEIHHI
jgi:FAD-dependent oxidoreductase domain-containing protein 1